ncbi:peptidase M28 [Flavipsychrobacter stenotrophus]|uniref:Carboxypeptidase Q n=1 Tax=Flavipsychrobacter stenotrophus TaxID=2077091 RepID=A0A2S7SR92_9BACT|nr:M20/M25/M40 family metallo-hydrolase [Flavipsychrobacter stenotrophus]PQJ09066.1 peptidase M28 [Flavipsychrobacter stenotrophus]
MKYTIILLAVAASILSFKGDHSERVDIHTVMQIKNEGFNNSKVLGTLFELTDVNGPRLTGSAGMKSAEVWAKNKLTEWGLANAAIEPWGGFGKGWEINKNYVAMTAPYYQALIACPKAWTPGTNGLVSGNAVLVKIDSVQDMAKYAGQLRGKIVVMGGMSTEVKPNFTADAKRYTDEELSKMLDWHNEESATNLSQKPKASAPAGRPGGNLRKMVDSFLYAEGATAVLSGGRGTMGTLFTSNGASRAWDAKPVLPEMEMGSEHLARLIRLLEVNKEVKIEMDTRTTFQTVDSIENNVIAEIPGTDKKLKSELVIIGAHMDSWHASTGTTDNATGVVVMMEAMRILKAIDIKPRRTIRIVLWSGEEQGLLGSRAYVKNHFADRLTMELKDDHKKVSAYYNLDNGAGKIRGIHLQSNDEVRNIFESWMEPFKDLGVTTATIRTTGSTDHISFDEVGIPGFQFIQDPLEYGSRTHHTNMDSYDRINGNDLMQASIIVASFVYNTAMRDEMIPRKSLPVIKK